MDAVRDIPLLGDGRRERYGSMLSGLRVLPPKAGRHMEMLQAPPPRDCLWRLQLALVAERGLAVGERASIRRLQATGHRRAPHSPAMSPTRCIQAVRLCHRRSCPGARAMLKPPAMPIPPSAVAKRSTTLRTPPQAGPIAATRAKGAPCTSGLALNVGRAPGMSSG